MKEFMIYFSDLNKDAQQRLLKLVGANDPKDMNWDMDSVPLTTIDFEEEMSGEAISCNSQEINDVYYENDGEEIEFSIADGTVCVFDTHGGDSKLNDRTGEYCVILRHLTADEADLFDVGPMYHIRFEKDGYETDAFEDELNIVENQ